MTSSPLSYAKIRALYEATYFAGLRKAGMPEESDQFVTDAEMEVREANSSPQDDDADRD